MPADEGLSRTRSAIPDGGALGGAASVMERERKREIERERDGHLKLVKLQVRYSSLEIQ
jgi:hypothetical protein